MKGIVFLFLIFSLTAQASDSLKILSEEQFVEIVRTYHPVARQAQLLVDRARAELLAARAGFDPQFYVYADRKTFDGKVYYDYTHPQVKIPTWFGMEVKAGCNSAPFFGYENFPGLYTVIKLLSKFMATIDILIPTYNGASCIEETIKSIISQSFSDFRIIVSLTTYFDSFSDQSTNTFQELVNSHLFW